MPLGQVKAEMKGKTPLDGKQANNYFRLHTDRCDMISLLSVRTASVGGHGRLASAAAIHDEMVDRAPDLVPLLYQPIERIWEGGKRSPSAPPRSSRERAPPFAARTAHATHLCPAAGERLRRRPACANVQLLDRCRQCCAPRRSRLLRRSGVPPGVGEGRGGVCGSPVQSIPDAESSLSSAGRYRDS